MCKFHIIFYKGLEHPQTWVSIEGQYSGTLYIPYEYRGMFETSLIVMGTMANQHYEIILVALIGN